MEIRGIVCDWCKQYSEGDSFTVYRTDTTGKVKGKSDYCEKCWYKMHTYPSNKHKDRV